MKGGEKGQWLPPYPWTLVCHSGWWHQPPGLQRPVHFTPYNCFPAWAGGSALDSKTTPPPRQGAFDEGSMGSHIRQGKTNTSEEI